MPDLTGRLSAALADRYRIERHLGAGGMATVYLAEDLKHKRKVALKVLKPELAAVLGAERFVQEITTTASLSHPHILPLFDSGTADGFLFYVMPFIEGETLRDKLNRETQLGVDEAVRIASEVADALDYAHRHGVIHRDIKPENILLHDGRPLVADFGIALAVSAAAGGRMTETGLSLGTPHYMSPEQATAEKEITGRSDVYSLASVLYEMLAGQPPHLGGSAQQIIMKIIAEPVAAVTQFRKSVPAHVAAAVGMALEKLPADRFESAKAFAAALHDPAFHTAATDAVAHGDSHARPASRSRVFLGVAILAVAVVAFMTGRAAAPGPEVIDVGLPDTAQLAFGDDSPFGTEWPALAVDPDGEFIVYVARVSRGTELWYRSLVGEEARPLPGTGGGFMPALSPNGRWVAFRAEGVIKRVAVDGSAAANDIAEVIEPWGFAWIGDDELLVASDYGIRSERVRVSDGVKTPAGGSCAWPVVIPGGRDLFCHAAGGQRTTRVVTLDERGNIPESPTAGVPLGDSTRPLVAIVSAPQDGHVVFVDEAGNLAAAAYDAATRRIGPRRIVRRGARRSQFGVGGHFGITSTGDLVYVPGSNGGVGRLVARHPDGLARELPIPAKEHFNFSASRDGRSIAVSSGGISGDELWVYDAATGQGDRVAVGRTVAYPTWAPDGALFFQVRRALPDAFAVMVLPAGGAAPVELKGGGVFEPSSFASRDLLAAGTTGEDVVLIRLDGDRVVRADTLKLASNQYYPVVSPDARWLAYSGTQKGISRIFVTPFPAMSRQMTVSGDAASEPLWLPDGSLVYRTGRCWHRLRPRPGATPPLAAPSPLFCDEKMINTSGPSNTVMPDGSILYLRTVGPTTGGFVRIVRGFRRSLERSGNEETGPR